MAASNINRNCSDATDRQDQNVDGLPDSLQNLIDVKSIPCAAHVASEQHIEASPQSNYDNDSPNHGQQSTKQWIRDHRTQILTNLLIYIGSLSVVSIYSG